MAGLPYHIEVRFPLLRPDNYQVTSPPDKAYNCIAWAGGVIDRRVWPSQKGYWWPTGISQEETTEAFIQFYARSGYELCGNADSENGYEKIAIYCDDGGTPEHAARQLPSGQWTSKLGEYHDITHNELDGVEIEYGYARVFMRRRRVP